MPQASKTPVDRRVDVAIVCALELEMAPIVKKLGSPRKTSGHRFDLVDGIMGRRRVAVMRCGTEGRAVEVAADALIGVHRPAWVLAAGFAVGLDETVRRGQIVVASEIVNEREDRLPVESAVASSGRLARGDVPVGRLVTVRGWPGSTADKRALHEQTGAVAADRQSFALARVCADRSVRVIAIRVLVDDLSGDAAAASRAVLHPSRSYRAGAVIGAFLSGSGRAARIATAKAAARKHAERLAAAVSEVVEQLART